MIPEPYDIPFFLLAAVLIGMLLGWCARALWSRCTAAGREAAANRRAWKMADAYYRHSQSNSGR